MAAKVGEEECAIGLKNHHRRFPATAMYMLGNNRLDSEQSANLGLRRSRRNAGDRRRSGGELRFTPAK